MAATDCGFSWQQMWTYYKSSLCSSEQRRFTLASFSLRDAIEVAVPKVQIEILEYAPEDVIEIVDDLLHEDAKKVLIKEKPVQLSSEDLLRIRSQFMGVKR